MIDMNEHLDLVQCDDCDHPISKSAEVCPNCGKRIKGSTTDQLALLIFILMLASAILAFFSLGSRH
jgi:RNA polymerase subunit RPABC4/transcription elongation factor Spt4